jgi:hypothetical protein
VEMYVEGVEFEFELKSYYLVVSTPVQSTFFCGRVFGN